jgi:GT2 family glycosyltransferase
VLKLVQTKMANSLPRQGREIERIEETMCSVDIVIVSFRSRNTLRVTVELLSGESDFSVIVVDNASGDGSLESVADLPAVLCAREHNDGFAAGCNAGWKLGDAPFILFLNPDAKIDPVAVRILAAVMKSRPDIGVVAPLIRNVDGALEYSQRRFPRLASTFAQALFLHRLFPRAGWADEVVRDQGCYVGRRSVEWASGACLLVRRGLLVEIGGWDERFFMYREDTDLCKRVHAEGYDVILEPEAVAVHQGGGSAPRAGLLPVLALSSLLYAEKHDSRASAALARTGIVLGSLTHAIVTSRGRAARRGHLRAAWWVLFGKRPA